MTKKKPTSSSGLALDNIQFENAADFPPAAVKVEPVPAPVEDGASEDGASSPESEDPDHHAIISGDADTMSGEDEPGGSE